jgi:hypothetical protein
MLHMNFRKAISLSALAAGLATSAFAQTAPFQFYLEQPAPNPGNLAGVQEYDLDFTKTSLNPAINYPTFPNPKFPQNIVRYQPHNFTASVGLGACFEISSSGPVGSDLIVSVQNQAGTWVWLADENAGNHQFRARFFIRAGLPRALRVSESKSPNPNNQNRITVRKLNQTPGTAITATSCRVAGLPYWQLDVNGGYPILPM